MILETTRLYLRKIQLDDYQSLCLFLQDIEVMYAWEHAFSDTEVTEWINENITRYERDGYSYWAVIEKTSSQLIGVTGLIAEKVDDENYVGVGYIYRQLSWGHGYAFEAASACVDYAINMLHLNEVTAQIRPENNASRKVAEKLGMTVKKHFVKKYKGKDMPHVLYSLTSQ
jgi:RimJ/RimL family protein N-acetyltransferase